MEKNDTHYIRFDWAAKHILRDKADFSVFEGFLTVLLKERVEIVELLESESNQQNEDDKFNRVDIKAKNSNGIRILSPKHVFPEYYILRVKAFNKEPENAMDEWMDYLKNERIRPDTTVPGLQEAKRRLDYLKMTVAEQKIYDNYLYNKFYREDVLNTSRTKGVVEGFHEGKAEGRAEGMQEGLAKGRTEGLQEGLEKGRAEGLKEAAAKMKQLGIPAEQIAQSTGIPVEEIKF
ncbi:MAG: hypothetical protein IJM65_02120 [Bacteroidales bacterium]|nr:hypothetical protein [Bacteroidales bacterium]